MSHPQKPKITYDIPADGQNHLVIYDMLVQAKGIQVGKHRLCSHPIVCLIMDGRPNIRLQFVQGLSWLKNKQSFKHWWLLQPAMLLFFPAVACFHFSSFPPILHGMIAGIVDLRVSLHRVGMSAFPGETWNTCLTESKPTCVFRKTQLPDSNGSYASTNGNKMTGFTQ